MLLLRWSILHDGPYYTDLPYVRRCGLSLPTEYRGLSVGLSVTLVSPAKTAAPIEMPFGLWAWMGRRNHVLDGVQRC